MTRYRMKGNDGLKERRYSYLQTPTKFIGEIHTILSAILIATFAIVIIVLSSREPESGELEAYQIGVITYMSVALVGSTMDLSLAIFLIYSARKMSWSKTLFWWRCTFVSIILFSLLSTCFCVLTGTSLLFLAVFPNALFKPFALYVVSGFLIDVGQQRAQFKQRPFHDDFELDRTEQDFVDSGPCQSSRSRPPSASSDEDARNRNDTGRRVFVQAEAHPEYGEMGDRVTTSRTSSSGDASLVQDILQEKFNWPSTARPVTMRVPTMDLVATTDPNK